jgi:hypothetical protein
MLAGFVIFELAEDARGKRIQQQTTNNISSAKNKSPLSKNKSLLSKNKWCLQVLAQNPNFIKELEL